LLPSTLATVTPNFAIYGTGQVAHFRATEATITDSRSFAWASFADKERHVEHIIGKSEVP